MNATLRLAATVLTAVLAALVSCQPSGTSVSGAAPGAAPGPVSGPAVQSRGGAEAVSGATTSRRDRSAVVSVQAEVVKAGPLTVQNSVAGTVAAAVQSAVAAGTTGTVLTLVRNAGDWVDAGTTVVKLDDKQLQLSLQIAEANLETAKINAGVAADGSIVANSKLDLQIQSAQSALAAAQKNYASAQALYKIGGIAGSDLDNALTQVQTAQANLEAAKNSASQNGISVQTASLQVQQAKLNMQYANIKSPYPGQIVAINVHPGEYVGASTAVFVLVSRSKVVNFSVPPVDAEGLGRQSKLEFQQNGKVWPIVLTGAPSAPVNGQIPLTASLPAQFPGTFGTVGSVQYSQTPASGTLLPLPAIQSLENKTFAFVIKDNKAVRADITILADSGSYAAVTGIDNGATVILNPPPGLLPGAAVKIATPGQTGQAPDSEKKWNGQRPQGQQQGQRGGS